MMMVGVEEKRTRLRVAATAATTTSRSTTASAPYVPRQHPSLILASSLRTLLLISRVHLLCCAC